MSRLISLLVRTSASRLAALPRVRRSIGRLRQRERDAPTAPFALRVDVAYHGSTASAFLDGHGQARATASGAAALVRSLLDGEIGQPGAWMPEQVIDPARFFEILASRDLHVTVRLDAASMDDDT